MPERAFDLVVVGDVNPDIVVTGAEPRFGQHEQVVASIEQTIGGSASIAAVGAAKLGLRVALVGVVGDDRFGRGMLAELADAGIDVTHCRTAPGRSTGASVILTRGDDRAIMTASGTIGDLVADDVPDELLARTRHVHVGSYFLLEGLRPGAPGLARRVHAAGATFSVDPNWDPSGAWDGGLPALLPEVDVLLPNAAEARMLTGRSDPIEAARSLASGGVRPGPGDASRAGRPLVVVKLGREGAVAVGPDGAEWRVPAFPIEPIDATGAGDAFDAAFLAVWLGGRPVEEAMALAVVAGALSTRGSGGTAGQPTLVELEATRRAWTR